MCYQPFSVKFARFKKYFLWAVLVIFSAFLGLLGWILWEVNNLPDVNSLADPDVSFQIEVSDWKGNTAPFTVGPENPAWTPLEEIPMYLRKAVLAGEDFSFYSHHGIDWYEVYQSFKRDIRERRFARGASTITQQLAKNLYLSRDKTISRKIKEIFLTRRLEKALTKDRILELYLNIVELGDMVYGVGEGAMYHFGKRPSELSLRECAFLAAMLPGPRVYNPLKHLNRVMNRSDHILAVMLKGHWITEKEYMEALVEVPAPYRKEGTSVEQLESPELPMEQTTVPGEAQSPADGYNGEAGGDTTSGTTGIENSPDADYPDRGGIVELPVGGEGEASSLNEE